MPNETSKFPALNELHDKLLVNGVGDDPLRVASALLGIIRAKDWQDDPATFHRWVEQLAMDVALAWAEKERQQTPPKA